MGGKERRWERVGVTGYTINGGKERRWERMSVTGCTINGR